MAKHGYTGRRGGHRPPPGYDHTSEDYYYRGRPSFDRRDALGRPLRHVVGGFLEGVFGSDGDDEAPSRREERRYQPKPGHGPKPKPYRGRNRAAPMSKGGEGEGSSEGDTDVTRDQNGVNGALKDIFGEGAPQLHVDGKRGSATKAALEGYKTFLGEFEKALSPEAEGKEGKTTLTEEKMRELAKQYNENPSSLDEKTKTAFEAARDGYAKTLSPTMESRNGWDVKLGAKPEGKDVPGGGKDATPEEPKEAKKPSSGMWENMDTTSTLPAKKVSKMRYTIE